MKEDFVSIETAQLARKAKFEWPCRYYLKMKEDGTYKRGRSLSENIKNKGAVISQPTLAYLNKWFIEIQDLYVICIPEMDNLWHFEIYQTTPFAKVIDVSITDYESHYEAFNEGLKRACLFITNPIKSEL